MARPTIVGTVDGLGYLYCTRCRPYLPMREYDDAGFAVLPASDRIPVYSDAAPHNGEACEGCGEPLTVLEPARVHGSTYRYTPRVSS